MIFIEAARIVILSQPKTGSVALQEALLGRSDIVFKRPDRMKHISYKLFEEYFAPMLLGVAGVSRSDYEVIAVMREPLSWLGSMYRYNSRDKWKDPDKRMISFTGDVSFDQFMLNVSKPHRDRPDYAKIGRPSSVAFDANGAIGVDRLFSYEDPSGIQRFIEERTGYAIETKKLNVSPERGMDLSDEARQRFNEWYKFDRELHASLRPDGLVDPRFRSA